MDVNCASYVYQPTLVAPAVTVSTGSNYFGKYPFKIIGISLSIYYVDVVTGLFVDGLCRFAVGSSDSNNNVTAFGTMAGGVSYDAVVSYGETVHRPFNFVSYGGIRITIDNTLRSVPVNNVLCNTNYTVHYILL
jgi:hypothetical protein